MDFKEFVKDNKNVALVGSFRPGCSKSFFDSQGSGTLYKV